MTVARRDQVLMTFFSLVRFIPSTFSRSEVSTKGPFLSDLLIRTLISGQEAVSSRQYLLPSADCPLPTYFGLRCTTNRSVSFRRRVLYRLVGCPHGETG